MKPFAAVFGAEPLLEAVNRQKVKLLRECSCLLAVRQEAARTGNPSRYVGLISRDGPRSHHLSVCGICGLARWSKRGAENLTRDVADMVPVRVRDGGALHDGGPSCTRTSPVELLADTSTLPRTSEEVPQETKEMLRK